RDLDVKGPDVDGLLHRTAHDAAPKKSISKSLTRSASSWCTQCDASASRSTRSRLGTSSWWGSARSEPREESRSPQMTRVGAEIGRSFAAASFWDCRTEAR